MNIPSRSVKETIQLGLKVIALPSKAILLSSIVVCIVLLITYFSWWDFLLPPAAIVLSMLYTMWATPRWRVWAYSNVSDIHQLQRSAELAGLLRKQSHDNLHHSFGNTYHFNQLVDLQKRFEVEPFFIDDPLVPEETIVYSNTFLGIGRKIILILNANGIEVESKGIFEWNEIYNERIIQISYERVSTNTGGNISSGSKSFLRFESKGLNLEIPISILNIQIWELDLLLYIYRGRFEQQRNTLPPGILLDNNI